MNFIQELQLLAHRGVLHHLTTPWCSSLLSLSQAYTQHNVHQHWCRLLETTQKIMSFPYLFLGLSTRSTSPHSKALNRQENQSLPWHFSKQNTLNTHPNPTSTHQNLPFFTSPRRKISQRPLFGFFEGSMNQA